MTGRTPPSRHWPFDPEAACEQLRAALPGWKVTHRHIRVVGGIPGGVLYEARRDGTLVDCERPGPIEHVVKRLCDVPDDSSAARG